MTNHEFLCGGTNGPANSIPFSGVSPGINSGALTIGGSLSYSAGGVINANQLGGVSLSSLPSGLLRVANGSGAPGTASASDVVSALAFTPENVANKGVAGGYAALDSSARMPPGQMPAFSGDVTFSGTAATVNAIQGRAVASTAPGANQVLQWNGSQWAPATAAGSVASVFGRTGGVTASAGDYNFAQISGIAAPSQLPGAAGWSGTLGNFTVGPGAGGSGNGSNNTAIGYGNLTANTTGYQNIAIGQNALQANKPTGSQNVAVGSLAMIANTTGSYYSAVGENALGNNTTGYDNFAFGLRALYQNTTGYNNSAFGIDSVGINRTGYRNSGYGTDSRAPGT